MSDFFVLFVCLLFLFVCFFCGWVEGSIFWVNEQKKDTSRRVISLDHNMADGSEIAMICDRNSRNYFAVSSGN